MQKIDTQIPIERFDRVRSTNLLARQRVVSGELGGRPRLFVARRQEAGLGRFGRRWASPVGGLWCTLAWPVGRDPVRVIDGLGLRLGLACVHVIDRVLAAHSEGRRAQLKWPNDVLIDGKKVLGLLAEVIQSQGGTHILVGVGVNGNFPASALPADLRPAATTLLDQIGCQTDLNRLIDDLRARLRDALMREGLDAGTLADLRDRLFGVGQTVTIALGPGETRTGALTGLDKHGRLVLETEAGPWTAPPGAELAHTCCH